MIYLIHVNHNQLRNIVLIEGPEVNLETLYQFFKMGFGKLIGGDSIRIAELFVEYLIVSYGFKKLKYIHFDAEIKDNDDDKIQ